MSTAVSVHHPNIAILAQFQERGIRFLIGNDDIQFVDRDHLDEISVLAKLSVVN